MIFGLTAGVREFKGQQADHPGPGPHSLYMDY